MDLTPQWSYLECIAAERLKNNQTKFHVSGYGTYIELIGAAGELAARRFFQLPEELHTHLDGGTDMYFKDMRIDIKATVWTPKLKHRFLQWPITKVIKSDVILLTAVNIDEKAAVIVGYALPHEISRAPINKNRDYACHEIPIPKLRKASGLLFAESREDLYPSHQVYKVRRQYSHPAGA
jgi:hypothetical protein